MIREIEIKTNRKSGRKTKIGEGKIHKRMKKIKMRKKNFKMWINRSEKE